MRRFSNLYALFTSVETRVEVNIPACTCDQSAGHVLTACKIKIIESVLCILMIICLDQWFNVTGGWSPHGECCCSDCL